MTRSFVSTSSTIALTVAALLASAPAAAQEATSAPAAAEADNGGLAEIVVTAQKREQNLQKVGISVTAVSGDQILERGISNSIDLITRTPSVDNYSPYGPGSSANIVIRGIGLNDFGEGHEAPVTVYVDEFYVVNVPAVDFALFDLDRAEILRGPQGTLFGRNSTGGLVHYVTKKPSQEAGGFVKGSYARFNELKLEGGVTAPLTDTLSARLSFLSHHSDGYIKNLNPQFAKDKGGQAGTDAVRLQLRYDDGDWDVLLKGEYGRTDKVHTYYEQTPSLRDPVTGLGSADPTGVDDAGYNEANFGAGKRNVAYTSNPQRLKSKGSTALLRAERDFGDVSFTSLTGYMHFTRNLEEDCDASPNTICVATFPYKSDTATQEFRAFGKGDGFNWTAGVYGLYSKARNNPNATFNVPVSGDTAVDPVTGLYNGAFFPINLAANWKMRTTSVAAFAQGEVELADRLTFTLGGRITRDSKKFDERDNASLRSCPGFPIPTNCFLPPNGPGIANPYRDTYKKTLISGKAALDFQVNADLLLFASVSRGTKAGGFNNGFYPGGVSTAQIPYRDENVIAYEIGEKATLFDRKLRFNTSFFYYDYNRYQTFNFEGIGGLLTNQSANAYGAEVEIQAAPVDHLELRFGGSWLETKIKDVRNGVPGGGVYVADREMSNAPKWTANGAIAYTVPLANDRSLVFNWDWNYRSSRYSNNFNDPSVKMPGYFKHNADISFNVNENWQLQAFVRNIGNKLAITKAFQFNDLGYVQYIYSEPRVFGASALYRF
ncbi:TonB-dependent receptor [Rhizorhabdus wittichii]|jgi:outer membrane receptor protein involved in Fe transport|uniref:TonB-dependent receptor n=1 Tax=Rhizorhabdus wittichii TaxID=160791 RepID=A0A975D3F3_9SPHN|nr:TonB-dependent receptor [Rhizorhabdus wittichii]ARR52073.1 ligand-gated channel protein [Rhizorhabdus wittichii DC-6]QTH22217.1 TonB-dependent receptor [Rhizorhabdus wittichii]